MSPIITTTKRKEMNNQQKIDQLESEISNLEYKLRIHNEVAMQLKETYLEYLKQSEATQVELKNKMAELTKLLKS